MLSGVCGTSPFSPSWLVLRTHNMDISLDNEMDSSLPLAFKTECQSGCETEDEAVAEELRHYNSAGVQQKHQECGYQPTLGKVPTRRA